MTPSIDQALHRFLTLLMIWTLLPNLTFYLIARGFHRTFATGAACKQRTLTPPDNWSCPFLDLHLFYLLRPATPYIDKTFYQFVTLLPDLTLLNMTFHEILVSIDHLQRVWHANRGRLLLWTPGSVPLWDLQVF